MTLPERWLRPVLVLLALLVASAGSWAAAGVLDRDQAQTEAEAYPSAPVDPVLSARRLGRSLQAPVARAALAPRVDALLAASPADTCLVAQVDGRPLASHQPDLPLVPASNQKVLTTWAALRVLGPDATFRTTLVSDAPVVGGVLEGDLWLVGGGDPLLMTDPWLAQFEQADQMVRTRFEDLADGLVAAGITRVAGAVVGDESGLDTVRTVPTWAPRLVEQQQAGPLSALLVDEGMDAFPARYLNRGAYVPTADPAIHAAGRMAALLAQRGVPVGVPPRAGAAPAGSAELAVVVSPPVSRIVKGVSTWSNNTGAELLVKAMDRARGGIGTTAGGTAVVAQELAAAGLPTAGVVVNDGSGLDEGDRVTCELLRAVMQDAGPDSPMAASLAVGGVDGTLRSRFRGTPAEGRIRGKSGSLRGVASLSGIVTPVPEPGAFVTFAVIANAPLPDGAVDIRSIQQQEPLVAALASYPEAPAVADLGPRDPVPTG